MKLIEYEDWILLIGTVLAALSELSEAGTKYTLAFLICGAIGKALLSLIQNLRQQ